MFRLVLRLNAPKRAAIFTIYDISYPIKGRGVCPIYDLKQHLTANNTKSAKSRRFSFLGKTIAAIADNVIVLAQLLGFVNATQRDAQYIIRITNQLIALCDVEQ